MSNKINEMAAKFAKENNTWHWTEQDIENFAKGIIKECIDIIEPGDTMSTDEWIKALRSAAQEIKDHFEVE